MSETTPSRLKQTTLIGKTDYWNDSCSASELSYAIDNGAVGATSNPTIVLEVVKREFAVWREVIARIAGENPAWDETKVCWKLIDEMGVQAARLLLPVFERENGRKGRISMQTNPQFYRDTEAILAHAAHFDSLAANIQVKIPVTKAGIAAIEEATFRGITVNATVNFTLPQSIAVAEAVERGLDRRTAAGLPSDKLTPVCTIMIGRLDDWLKIVAKTQDIILTPGHLDWAGIAVMKKAYPIFQQRGYRARLLVAAYRHHMHWSALVGGDIIHTIPYAWQRLYNASDIDVRLTQDEPVDPAVVEEIYRKFPDFRRAYDEGGLSLDEFDTFGATVRTLRNFIGSYHELVGAVRDVMLPDPDR